MPEQSERNLVRTGLLVLLVAGLGFSAAAVIPRLPWIAMNTYRFEVPLVEGIGALVPGSRVIVAGLDEGEVISTAPLILPAEGAAPPREMVEVVIEVRRSLALFEGTAARLVSPAIGSGTNVELVEAFSPGRSVLADGAVLDWARSPGLPDMLLGESAWSRLQSSWRRIESFVDAVPQWRKTLGDDLRAIREEFLALRGSVEDRLEAWRPEFNRLREVPDRAKEGFAELRASATTLEGDWGRLTEGLDQLRARFKATIPAAGGDLEEFSLLQDLPDLSNLQAVTASIGRTWQRIEESGDRVAGMLAGPWDWARVDLELFLANFNIASAQFDRLLGTLVERPIRTILLLLGVELHLLPNPGERQQLLADAVVRNFARAVADLRMAQQALEEWISLRPVVPEGPEIPAQIEQAIRDAERRMQEAAEAVFRQRMQGR